MKILKEQTSQELRDLGYAPLQSKDDAHNKKYEQGWTVKKADDDGKWYGLKPTKTQPQVEEDVFNDLIMSNYDEYTDNEGKIYYGLVVGEGDNLKSLHLYPKGKVIDKL